MFLYTQFCNKIIFFSLMTNAKNKVIYMQDLIIFSIKQIQNKQVTNSNLARV